MKRRTRLILLGALLLAVAGVALLVIMPARVADLLLAGFVGVALLAGYFGAVVVVGKSVFRRQHVVDGCCANCGYDLRGLDGGRCPECGSG